MNAQEKPVGLLEAMSPGSGGPALELMSSASREVQCSCFDSAVSDRCLVSQAPTRRPNTTDKTLSYLETGGSYKYYLLSACL